MFGNAEIKVRPVKLAYLVDPNNAKQVREAIQLSSSLWGGAFFPIIALYRRMPATWRDTSAKRSTGVTLPACSWTGKPHAVSGTTTFGQERIRLGGRRYDPGQSAPRRTNPILRCERRAFAAKSWLVP